MMTKTNKDDMKTDEDKEKWRENWWRQRWLMMTKTNYDDKEDDCNMIEDTCMYFKLNSTVYKTFLDEISF